MANTIVSVLRKYSVVIAFPTIAVGTIWADYSHTQKWKRQVLLSQQREKQEIRA